MALSTTLRRGAGELRRRTEFGDFVLFIYVAAVARVAVWGVASNLAAWPLALALSLAACLVYLRAKEGDEDEAGAPAIPFWLVVAPPLAFVYALRVAHPDFSFDVLNYHLLQQERATWGPLLQAGDFFPTPAPHNPTPNIVHGIFRHLLGYRLGTVVNLLALLWAGRSLDKLLRPHVAGHWARAAAVLLCLTAEHLLFEVSTYMVDLLGLPLTLEAARLALRPAGRRGDESEAVGWEVYRRRLLRVAFLLGLSVCFKLTNVASAVPVVLLCAYKAVAHFRPGVRTLATTALAAGAAFLAPVLPFAAYIYGETGSPLFPVYNKLFKSPYWPQVGGNYDPRWGPKGALEILTWPLRLPFETERLCEIAVYTGRVTLGFVAALCALALPRRWGRGRVAGLALTVALGSLLWGASTGYARYAFPFETLSAALVVALASMVGGARGAASGRRILASLLWAVLVAQSALACYYVYQYEWGGRPTFFHSPDAYGEGARELLRDRSLRSYLPEGDARLYDDLDLWVVSGSKAGGIQALLNARVPYINLREPHFFATDAGREKFERAVDAAAGKRLRSLCLADDFAAAMQSLSEHGLAAEDVRLVSIPYFRTEQRPSLFLYGVRRAAETPGGQTYPLTDSRAILADEDYRAGITLEGDAPTSFGPGETRVLSVKVRNRGRTLWPARGQADGRYQFAVIDRWLDAAGSGVVNRWDGRMALYRDLAPGEELQFWLVVTAPTAPGEYVVEVDVLHEWVTSFREKGSEPLLLRVQVR